MNILKIIVISLLFTPLLVIAHHPDGDVLQHLPSAGFTPESRFYFLDKVGEAIRELFTFNPESKARLQLTFAAERLAEIKVILETKGVEAKGLEVAKARLEANAAKAVAIVEQEKAKGKEVSKLAGEIVDNFHTQREAAKQVFEAAKEEFKAKKRELHNQLLAAIEAGDTALQEQIRAELLAIEAAKDEAEAKKDATISALEEEKDRLQDELEEEKRQEDEARDAAERAEEEKEEREDEDEDKEDEDEDEDEDENDNDDEENKSASCSNLQELINLELLRINYCSSDSDCSDERVLNYGEDGKHRCGAGLPNYYHNKNADTKLLKQLGQQYAASRCPAAPAGGCPGPREDEIQRIACVKNRCVSTLVPK